MADAGALLGCQQLPGASAEELLGRLALRCRGVEDVDDSGGSIERLVKTLAGKDIDPGRPRQHHHLVARPSQALDEGRAHVARAAGDGHALWS
jgi:hypothetical protein